MEALIVNPAKRRTRRRRKSSAKRRTRRRMPPRNKDGSFRKRRTATKRRRTRAKSSTTRRRTTRRTTRKAVRRRRRRNPGGIMRGLDLQTAFVGALGGAAARMIVNQVGSKLLKGKASDPKVKGAMQIGAGILLSQVKAIPAKFRGPLATGAQIAGVTQILADVQPNLFGGIVPEFDANDIDVLGAPTIPALSLVESGDMGEEEDFGLSELDEDLEEIPGAFSEVM